MTRFVSTVFFSVLAGVAAMGVQAFTFDGIDGNVIDTAQWANRPVLVVNTASRCGYTPQYNGLQDLQDRYAEKGLVVLAVPSNDFNQELDSAEKVKDFCAMMFDITLEMTDITHVKGHEAHPFYQWVRGETGFEPAWNFNKVLIGADGRVVATYESAVEPLSQRLTTDIEAELEKSGS